MPYTLPDGTIIQNPSLNRYFSLGDGVLHPERNLDAWNRQGILDQHGITYEEPTVPVPTQSLNQLKRAVQNAIVRQMEDFLINRFSLLRRILIVQEYARGDATKRAQINEVWDWENNIIDAALATIDQIAAAPDEAALRLITWDFSAWEATKPSYNIKQLLS